MKKTPNQGHVYANIYDKEMAKTFEEREKDWRNGAIVYQVLVDRFAPSTSLEEKKHLYTSPKVLRSWDEVPKKGKYLEKEQLWSHEIEFWGGDLDSLEQKLDYIHGLNVDVLYLNPIHLGYTNHKYDSLDYHKVSPEFGTRKDVNELTEKVHAKGMKIVLDGVFNHMGKNAEIFQQGLKDKNSPYRDWFYFGDQYEGGHRAWANALNLPEINLENKDVRDHVYGDKDSVVRSYLNEGIDGWRLDVAYDLGFKYLSELTQAAHKEKPGSLVVGEIWNYPSEWFPAIDGVMNFTAREIIWQMLQGNLDPHMAMHMLTRMIDDSGIDNMLKSWLVLDNHDTSRLKNMLPEAWQQHMAQVLQFTLPGSPNVYYGNEIGMTGGEDPEMRAPMRWDWVNDKNKTLKWTKKLINIHQENRALKIGNFRPITTKKFIAYERYTDRVGETIIVVANPHPKEIQEMILVANAKIMNWGQLKNLLNEKEKPLHMRSGLLNITLPPGGVAVFTLDTGNNTSYTPFKRVQ